MNQEKQMTTATTTDRNQALKELGFSMESSPPLGNVRDNDWPCIEYKIRVKFKGRTVYDDTFRLGVGHVNPKGKTPAHLSIYEQNMLGTWKADPYAKFQDKQSHANLAARLAYAQRVKPSLEDVVQSLISDGEAYFNAQSFEDWASDYGLDPDSRKAEAIYRACDTIGRAFSRAMTADELAKAREIVQDL